MSTVFNRCYAVSVNKKLPFATKEDREQIGILAKEDFFTNHRSIGKYGKKKAHHDDGDFEVINYPPKYTTLLDAIIESYLKDKLGIKKERKRNKVSKPVYSTKTV
jgi:hypothetical protein